jgi:hypothetical protein
MKTTNHRCEDPPSTLLVLSGLPASLWPSTICLSCCISSSLTEKGDSQEPTPAQLCGVHVKTWFLPLSHVHCFSGPSDWQSGAWGTLGIAMHTQGQVSTVEATAERHNQHCQHRLSKACVRSAPGTLAVITASPFPVT